MLRAIKLWGRQRLGLAFHHPVQVIRHVELHGDPDYGGWCVCPDGIDARSIVYDCGVGADISFATSLVKRYGLRVWAFDPTPSSIRWFERQPCPAEVVFRPYGIADADGRAKLYLPDRPGYGSGTLIPDAVHAGSVVEVEVKRLVTIMAELGHRTVDILKLDIEGAEYAVLRDILDGGLAVEQILVEFHHAPTSRDFARARAAIEQLNLRRYRIFALRHGTDFSFIRTADDRSNGLARDATGLAAYTHPGTGG